eukprot:2685118-Prymnesium_polylepis.1
MSPPSPPLSPLPSDFMLTGLCSTQPLEGEYKAVGFTASGAPFFQLQGSSVFIYWDPSCNGGTGGTARWIIDSDEPSTSALSDLDGDAACNYGARFNSADSSSPPLGGSTWRVSCSGVWTDNELTLLPPSPPSPSLPPTSAGRQLQS